MHTKYNKYKEIDFLNDDYFVKSLLNPTSESEALWNILINEKKIDENEFLSAYITLKSLHGGKPEVPTDRIDAIWEKLINTNKKKIYSKRMHLIRNVSAACAIVAVLVLSAVLFVNSNNNKEQSFSDLAQNYIHNSQHADNQIQLVSGEKTLELAGSEADVEYDANGQLKVNNRSVLVKQQTARQNKNSYSQLRVPYGKRAYLKLADGTSLWVNSGSTIIYPTVFADDKREIYVEGEVYADVYHDKNWPFVVTTDKIDIRVLGTTFNVTAYKESLQVDVVLVNGAVNVKTKNGKETRIKPNQMFTYTDQACTLEYVDVENYISWREGKYKFKNEPIENILLRLSRYYNVTMILPTKVSGITCSGKLELKDDLNSLLNGLSEITSMTYANKDNEYRIRFD
mgnify:CR=1 FL=1